MALYPFQLAYTISPRGDFDDDAARDARRRLRSVEWETIKHIETTLLGELDLNRSTLSGRIAQAEEMVSERIKDELRDLKVLSRIKFRGSLMVDGLGAAIGFSLS